MPTKQLIQFYMSYAGWLDMGAPDNVVFKRNGGLCSNLQIWCGLHGANHHELDEEMEMQFLKAGLHGVFPFNDQRLLNFSAESSSNTCHTNEQRINWVRTHSVLGVTLYPELVEEAKQQ